MPTKLTVSGALAHLMTAMTPILHVSGDDDGSRLQRALTKAASYVNRALPVVASVAGADRPHAGFDKLSNPQRLAVRDAFTSVLAVGQILRDLVDRAGSMQAWIAVRLVLTALTPYVSRADTALERVLLDDEPFEDALRSAGRAR